MRPKALMIIAMLLLFGLVGCTTSQEAFSTQEYILTTGIHDGGLSFIGVSGEINGVYNPN